VYKNKKSRSSGNSKLYFAPSTWRLEGLGLKTLTKRDDAIELKGRKVQVIGFSDYFSIQKFLRVLSGCRFFETVSAFCVQHGAYHFSSLFLKSTFDPLMILTSTPKVWRSYRGKHLWKFRPSESALLSDAWISDSPSSTLNAASSTVSKLSSDLWSFSDFSSSHDFLGESVETLLVPIIEDATVVSQSDQLLNNAHNHLFLALDVVGLTIGSTSLGGLLTISAVDSLLGVLGRVVGVQFVKGLLLLFVEVIRAGVHLVVVGDTVDAVLAGNHASLSVIDLEVLVTVLVVTIPEGSVVKVGLNAVHSAEEVKFVGLVALVTRQDEDQEAT
jgi:hypothetical protein